MPSRARTPLTLTVGVAIGLLIGGYVHQADAQNTAIPCAKPPTVKATPAVKGHPVLATYDGSTTTTKPDDFGSYDGKTFTYRGPITVTFTGTQIDPKKIADGSLAVDAPLVTAVSAVGQIAIAPGDKRTQTITATFSAADNQCKFGCQVSLFEAANLSWHIVVTE